MPDRTTSDEQFAKDLAGMLAAPHTVPLGLKPGIPWFDFDLAFELGLGYANRDEIAATEAVAATALASPGARLQAAGHLLTAVVHMSRGRFRRAWSAAGKAAKTVKVPDPDVAAEVAYVRGLVLEGKGNHRDASRQYALVADSGRPRTFARAALAMGGMLARETQDWDQDAFDTLSTAVATGFEEVVGPARLMQALMADRVGDHDVAASLYREAAHTTVPHTAAQASFHLGDLLRSRGDTQEARTHLAVAARSSDPEFSAKGALALGILLMEAGESADALEVFTFASNSRYEPGAARAHCHLGLLAIDAGDFANGERHLRIAQRHKDPQIKAAVAEGLAHLRNARR
ncbi:tetratricopeptide repeat protein [Kitasatospora sp. NPDC051170]|uniref:tetratricopeptide repeat protein n=1 Tax=Kitasatospora sp. NPDC051170 TaxID=3364056 RepID=UPI0037B3F9A4